MRSFALALALITLGCAGPAARPFPARVLAGSRAAGPPATCRTQPATRVDVLEAEAPLGEALERLGRRVGWNLVCEPAAARRPASLRVFDLPWREALGLLLERTGCEAEAAGERTLYVTYPPRVTITSCGSAPR